MRFIYTALLGIFATSVCAEQLFPGLKGEQLVQALRKNYHPAATLSYKKARQKLFTEIDASQGAVTLCYTGALFSTTGIPPGNVVNTEHTWPQSYFKDANGGGMMKSDLHHLFASEEPVNQARGRLPFGDIDDSKTTAWYRSKTPQSTIPPASTRDEFSEATSALFEPREAHKGNAARSLFYFFAVYGDQQINHDWFKPQVMDLLKWNKADPPDQIERARSKNIAAIQGTENPFVIDPTLADRVFNASIDDAGPAGAPLGGMALSAGQLRVGAWNIENLGTKHGDDDGEDQTPEALADYIMSSQVQVLALEEIHDDDQPSSNVPGMSPWRNTILASALQLISQRTGETWSYELTAPGAQNDRQQLTGVAWNTTKVRLEKRQLVNVAGGSVGGASIWSRVPEAFYFKTADDKTDFALIPLHMKSNSNGPRLGQRTRKKEAEQLFEALPELEESFDGEKDIILLGDTNMLHDEQTAEEAWSERFKDLNFDERYTYIKPYNNQPLPPFDRIFVPLGQPEFENSEQVIHGPEGDTEDEQMEWKRAHLRLRSDHLLIWTDIMLGDDDD